MRDLVERKEVGGFISRTHAERAKLAADKTDVGEIDVAGDDVADDVADQPLPQFVGRDHHPEEIVAVGVGQQPGIPRAMSTPPSSDVRTFSIAARSGGETRRCDITPGCALQRLPIAPTELLHYILSTK